MYLYSQLKFKATHSLGEGFHSTSKGVPILNSVNSTIHMESDFSNFDLNATNTLNTSIILKALFTFDPYYLMVMQPKSLLDVLYVT